MRKRKRKWKWKRKGVSKEANLQEMPWAGRLLSCCVLVYLFFFVERRGNAGKWRLKEGKS